MTIVVHNRTRGPVRIVDLVVPRWTSVPFDTLTSEQRERLMKAEAYGEVRCEPSLLPPVEVKPPPIEPPINPPEVTTTPGPKRRKR